MLLALVDSNARRQRGGIVADFTFGLRDVNGLRHEFRAQTFFNTHYFQTLIVHLRQFKDRHFPVVVPHGSTLSNIEAQR